MAYSPGYSPLWWRFAGQLFGTLPLPVARPNGRG